MSQASRDRSIMREISIEKDDIHKQDVNYNKDQIKFQLACIKERVMRKNKVVAVRRAK